MSELAREIIRQQWPKRHDRDETIRRQATSLIYTHIEMIRKWRAARESA